MTVLAMMLAASLAAQVAQDEELLRTGQVVASAPVGEGVTQSQRLTLERDGRRCRAIFKTVEERFEDPYRFGAETSPNFRDSCFCEVAAYEIDQMLGLGLVPCTVARKIEGKQGSVQMWIEDVIPRWAHGQPPPPPGFAALQAHAVRLLDYLIFNTDRHIRDIAFRRGWKPLVIDHSIAFRSFQVAPRPLYRFPAPVVERMRQITRADIDQRLSPYLDEDERDGLEQRLHKVVALVDETVAARGAEHTLFDWP